MHIGISELIYLYDINKAEEDDCFDLDLEWNVVHFLIHLTMLLYDAGYEG